MKIPFKVNNQGFIVAFAPFKIYGYFERDSYFVDFKIIIIMCSQKHVIIIAI